MVLLALLLLLAVLLNLFNYLHINYWYIQYFSILFAYIYIVSAISSSFPVFYAFLLLLALHWFVNLVVFQSIYLACAVCIMIANIFGIFSVLFLIILLFFTNFWYYFYLDIAYITNIYIDSIICAFAATNTHSSSIAATIHTYNINY